MKSILAILMLSLFAFSCSPKGTAKTSVAPASGMKVLSGTLVKKPWTKSTESYCAQGSAYLILQVDGENHVLAYSEKLADKLIAKDGKKVSLKGQFVTRTIEHPDDGSQHPVTAGPDGEESNDNSFTCTVFQVNSIE